MKKSYKVTRRGAVGLVAATAVAGFTPVKFAIGAKSPVKIGMLLPYSGTFARLGGAITNALLMNLQESGDMIAGRPVEFVKIDSEAKPPKATELTTKLIAQENVDFLIGPVHSGVAMAMAKIAREEGTLTIVPNAGANQITGPLCAPNVFRSSFTNWQPGYPLGKILLDEGKKDVVLCYWNYGAGKQAAGGFKDGFVPKGGNVIKELEVPFPDVEFQAVLTEIASIGPDAVFTFFSGGGAVKFVRDWQAAGLKDSSVELVGSFITEGVTKAQGDAAEGIRSTLHYADTLDNPTNKAFRSAYRSAFDAEADVFAVQGYDAGRLVRIALEAVDGDTDAKDGMIAAMETAEFESPRGPFKLSKAHNPIQNIYLREVRNGVNEVVGIAHEGLADPAKGCKL